MKIIIAGLLLMFSGVSFANPNQHYGHRHWNHHHWHNKHHWQHRHNWVIPALIGGAVAYAATRPAPIIFNSQPIIQDSNYILINGEIYTKQIMFINGVEQEVLVRIQ